jgi:outer membrane usher protein
MEGEADLSVDGMLTRRGTRLVYDIQDDALRMTVGDIVSSSTSFQAMPSIVGAAIERSYGKLRPGRSIRPTGKRSFRIERPSDVRVLVNDREIRRLRLMPGEYDLDDLPLARGANDIRLKIKNDLGEEQEINFSVLFNRSLLDVGVSEWQVSAGLLTHSSLSGPIYDQDKPALLTSYRRGLLENLTVEGALQATPKTSYGRLNALIQAPFGLLMAEGAVSNNADSGTGWLFNSEIEISPKEFQGFGSLHLAAEVASPHFVSSLTRTSENNQQLRLSGSYNHNFGADITGSVSAHYDLGFDEEKTTVGWGVAVNRTVDNGLAIGLSGAYETSGIGSANDTSDISVMGHLRYRVGRSTSAALTYDQTNRSISTSLSSEFGHGRSRVGLDLDFSHDNVTEKTRTPENALSGTINYIGDRLNLSASRKQTFSGLASTQFARQSSLNVNSALVFADGVFAVSRPVYDSFALVQTHENLGDRTLRISPNENGYRARSDIFGPAVVTDISSYSLTRLPYDVEDLPPGYNLGSGSFDLLSPYRAGYTLMVGSDATVSIGGVLQRTDGKPLTLLAGTASNNDSPNSKVSLFTNDAGRFLAQGLHPGRWIIEMASSPPTKYEVLVDSDATGLIDVGVLSPLP